MSDKTAATEICTPGDGSPLAWPKPPDPYSFESRACGSCVGCDQLAVCVEQDECYLDHHSLFRMAQYLHTEQKWESQDG